MPLRDHFRPPVRKRASWEALHGQWPGRIVQQLRTALPPGYRAEPRVHLGAYFEVDVATYEDEDVPVGKPAADNTGEVATAAWTVTEPTVAVETTLPDAYEYEVLVYDAEQGQQLVAAIEIVSPANKDRPEHRNVFVAKCAALLQKGVAVSIVDLVTPRHFNLYADLLEFIGHHDATMGAEPPHLYAASCRWVRRGKKTILEAWSHVMMVGQPLPTLPLWLAEDKVVALELEVSYEQACHDLWIT